MLIYDAFKILCDDFIGRYFKTILSSCVNIICLFLQEQSPITKYLEFDGGLLVVSTLDGSLIGIDQKTGKERWTLKNSNYLHDYNLIKYINIIITQGYNENNY